MPLVITILFGLAGLIFPTFASRLPSAHAQDLNASEVALSRRDYAQSRQLATEEIRAGTRTGSELVASYRVLALACGHLDDADGATRAFATLLALDPSYRIPGGLPIEVRSPYMDARGFWSAHVQRLSADLALGDNRTTLTVGLHDPASVSARVRVRARIVGHRPFMEFVRPSAPVISLDLEGLAGADQWDYAITLLDEHGNRVWQLGTDTHPLRLKRPTDTQVVAARVAPSTAPVVTRQRPRDRPESAWRKPYLVVGGSLLGLGVGAVAVAAYSHAKREQLAGRWNRGDCDGSGTTRGTICASEDKQIERRTQLAVGLYSAGAVSLISGLTLLLLAPARNPERGGVPGLVEGRLPELPPTSTPPLPATGGGMPPAPVGVGIPCSDLTASGKAVHITGSTAAKPFLQQIAQQLAPQKVYLVYTSTGSCVGVNAVLNAVPMTTGPAPAPALSAIVWDSPTSTGKACDLPAEGVAADLGISDVFAQTCPGFELANLDAQQIRDAHGPVQTMTFAVPANAEHTALSAQAAYFVFGFGKEGGVLDAAGQALWHDEEFILQRSAASGTQAMIAAAIGVPASRWKGKKHGSSDDVASSLQLAGANRELANKAIGILAADYIDGKNLRAQIRVLAYRDSKQGCAVYPDSTASAHDKRNVRDGHYPIWSPLHLLYKVDRDGNPANLETRGSVNDIVGYLSGTKALPNGVRFIDLYAQIGLIPECAMRVTRLKDGGNITPSTPSSPCSCLFELKATGATACMPCKVQGDCGANETCSQGYCESLAGPATGSL